MKRPEPGTEPSAGRLTRGAILTRLQLIRLPNLFTAMADVLAGYLIVTGGGFRWGVLCLLLLSTSSLYAAGCVLNDLRDHEIDRRERPFRPLPSGRVPRREATILCAALFASGLLAALAAGEPPFFIAAGLVGLIAAYDLGAKHRNLLGPATMGACRAGNLLLGMAPALSSAGFALVLPTISFCYVFFLTRLSRFEVEGAREGKLWWIAAGWLGVLAGLFGLITVELLRPDALPFLFLLLLFTAAPLHRAVSRAQPPAVERAVKMLVLGLPMLDAVYASGVQGWEYGLPVALLLVPSLWLARILYIT